MEKAPPSARATVRRIPKRADYDPATVRRILDEGFVCHVSFVDGGAPFIIPLVYARRGDELILHGAASGRLAARFREGADISLAVTLVDGFVMAKSAFHHSVNYRSVILFGRPREIVDLAEKRAAMNALVDFIAPGRAADTRPPSDPELKGTAVFAMSIAEASAKIRTGPPLEDPDDMTLPFWSGVIPWQPAAGTPVPVSADIPLPAYLASCRRPPAS